MRILIPKEQLDTGAYGPVFDWSQAATPPRLELAILVGEFAYNLRAALDYLVHQLAALDNAQPRLRHFPIEIEPQQFKKRRATWLKGLTNNHVELMRSSQPFAGAHWLYLLKAINNPDKHEGLSLVVSQFSGPLSISKEQLIPIPGDDDRLELPQPEQNIEFLLIDRLPLEASLHVLLFEMAKLLDEFRPMFGDKQKFNVSDPGAVITSEQQISTSDAV